MIFIVIMTGLAVIQSERNHCYWHGSENALPWLSCLTHALGPSVRVAVGSAGLLEACAKRATLEAFFVGGMEYAWT